MCLLSSLNYTKGQWEVVLMNYVMYFASFEVVCNAHDCDAELGSSGAEDCVVGFECPCKSPGRRVEAQSDGVCMLVGSVEGIAETHQDGVALYQQRRFLI